MPLRCRLFQTNRPERKNMSAMKNMSLKPTKSCQPDQRWESMTGKACHQRGCGRRDDGAAGGRNGQSASTAWCATTRRVMKARRYPMARL